MTDLAALPSSAIPAADWEAAHERLVTRLVELIRIPSVNPPPTPGADGETRVARYLEEHAYRPASPPPGRPARGRPFRHLSLD